MSEIQHRLPPVHQAPVHHPASVPLEKQQHQVQQFVPPPRPQSQNSNHSQNPVHPNAKTTTHVNNGTTTTKTNITSPVCRNCKTQTTPLWRRDETGQVLCNACGLFLKLHGRPRPISLKTDTIKLRNRIKQHPQGTIASATGSSSKNLSGSNTPELKLKDSSQNLTSSAAKIPGKKSPKIKKSKPASDLTPLLPATTASGANTPSSLRTPSSTVTASGAFPHPISNTFHHHHHHHHLPPHLTPHNPSQIHSLGGHNHVVQPLHYPSSTPAQFAPGLQRITSPLLLSTTSSISNARDSEKLNPVHAAAGALENMSNELGPSATFKSGGSSINGVSLMNKSRPEIKKESSSSPSIFSTPSSALSAPHYTSNNGLHSASSSTAQPPKLPALGISSPSFGPQFHLPSQQHSQSSTPAISQIHSPENSHASTAASSASAVTSLPPIQQVAGENKGSLPHFQSSFNSHFSQYSNTANNPQQSNGYGYNGGDNNSGNNNNNNNNNNSGNNNNGDGGPGSGPGSAGSPYGNHEITLLKTRISELELVNDLYRTRIMELEAMEQAARLREISMRKRLDEVLNLNNSQRSPQTAPAPAPVPAQAPAPTQAPSAHVPAPHAPAQTSSTPLPPSSALTPASSIPTTSIQPGSSNSTISAPSSGLPPFQHQIHLQQHHHPQEPSQHPLHHHATMLPSIRQVSSSSSPSGSGITLPSLKRENEDMGLFEDDLKKPKLGQSQTG